MKIGDLVKFKGENENDPSSAKGILVEIRDTVGGTHAVMWDFLVDTGYGMIGWQRKHEIEVISENR
tara:strand:+ start:263 stop:460 length:198 start_codon:yes stop_codon:yes gene_type:complete